MDLPDSAWCFWCRQMTTGQQRTTDTVRCWEAPGAAPQDDLAQRDATKAHSDATIDHEEREATPQTPISDEVIDRVDAGCTEGHSDVGQGQSKEEDDEEHELLAILNLDRESDTETIGQLQNNARKCQEPWLDYLRWLAGVVKEKEAEGILVNAPV